MARPRQSNGNPRQERVDELAAYRGTAAKQAGGHGGALRLS
jgi:hypothetical protein